MISEKRLRPVSFTIVLNAQKIDVILQGALRVRIILEHAHFTRMSVVGPLTKVRKATA